MEYSCDKCKYKSPRDSNKFCELDDDEGSAACFRYDHFTLAMIPGEGVMNYADRWFKDRSPSTSGFTLQDIKEFISELPAK